MSKVRIAISVGDLNGVGIEIAIKAHEEVSKLCAPLYCINSYMLNQASTLLNYKIPSNFEISEVGGEFAVKKGCVDKDSGRYSYDSFIHAISLCEQKKADAVVTMPIHKEAWMLAGLKYKGHTDLLREHFKRDAIMMLGCQKMFVALFSEHIPLKDVASSIKYKKLKQFFLDFNNSVPNERVAVLGLNPHAGDNGVLGNEELIITKAIKSANKKVCFEQFIGPLVPDIAFTPHIREKFKYFIAMYHDQGLAPLKALYFDESINVSLNLPIIRTSVDHGTAFDIAYEKKAKTLSYINAIKSAIALGERL
ncbi:4-hydroxythreonine-4-phosphate dehydrogenase [Sulfurimonas denitrificans DSM 1251]|uniref:4-hydroxythreonine-4-phosphate dehydrogenase n=1 Tax=Sulfurimonas denitrificans (strain ATCC 33889 / DSM 1251) TaxID=326298 RepID=PDXA_SULDN|nr:4-hydroxythreonine-4-phosphate dehydrogenase [Sulfurimonas denitrificans]Q30S58.1 RecName: Full=4-hydroxythreonine-4-phosphate dehydrogenase; AltName: Full=4-(phosphohydroxy)-L-threonine dehydrogenase [Sulfurimonas denitrificans DSM 1251]ABB44173.1 4-hydroxythreonine-4-phosphate dehydrogenase [Sulfurimonas denitrificans DSM 1251]